MFGSIVHLVELVHNIHNEFEIAWYYFADLQAREEHVERTERV